MSSIVRTALLLAALWQPALAMAQAPERISYQGVLTLDGGAAVADGDYDIRFRIFGQEELGTHLFEQTLTVAVRDGLYNVILSDNPTSPLPLREALSGTPRFMEVALVSGPGISSLVVFSPRQELTSVPYALYGPDPPAPPGLLVGRFEYASAESVKLATGTGGLVAIEIDGAMMTSSSDITFDITLDLGAPDAPNTNYYCYLENDEGTPTPHISSTAPALSGKKGYHPTNAGWRYVGAFRNNGSLNVTPFRTAGDLVIFRENGNDGPRTFTLGTTVPTGWTTVNAPAPLTAASLLLHVQAQCDDAVVVYGPTDAPGPLPAFSQLGSSRLPNPETSQMEGVLAFIGGAITAGTGLSATGRIEIPVANQGNPGFQWGTVRTTSAGTVIGNFAMLVGYRDPLMASGR